MILSIMGIVIGLSAIGLFIWLKNDQKMSNSLHEGDLQAAKYAFDALMDDFTNYQVETDRKIIKLEKQLEINSKEYERKIVRLTTELPKVIRKVIGHIEFARPLDKK